VDYFHPNATNYWMDMLDILKSKLNFSGLWLDMNEISHFCDGPCSFSNTTPIFDYSKDLPYQLGRDSIEAGTISLNSTHYGGIK
jgi:alpha-glucosidase (family GH31 glycosyl hydrolase)